MDLIVKNAIFIFVINNLIAENFFCICAGDDQQRQPPRIIYIQDPPHIYHVSSAEFRHFVIDKTTDPRIKARRLNAPMIGPVVIHDVPSQSNDIPTNETNFQSIDPDQSNILPSANQANFFDQTNLFTMANQANNLDQTNLFATINRPNNSDQTTLQASTSTNLFDQNMMAAQIDSYGVQMPTNLPEQQHTDRAHFPITQETMPDFINLLSMSSEPNQQTDKSTYVQTDQFDHRNLSNQQNFINFQMPQSSNQSHHHNTAAAQQLTNDRLTFGNRIFNEFIVQTVPQKRSGGLPEWLNHHIDQTDRQQSANAETDKASSQPIDLHVPSTLSTSMTTMNWDNQTNSRGKKEEAEASRSASINDQKDSGAQLVFVVRYLFELSLSCIGILPNYIEKPLALVIEGASMEAPSVRQQFEIFTKILRQMDAKMVKQRTKEQLFGDALFKNDHLFLHILQKIQKQATEMFGHGLFENEKSDARAEVLFFFMQLFNKFVKILEGETYGTNESAEALRVALHKWIKAAKERIGVEFHEFFKKSASAVHDENNDNYFY